MQPLSLTLSYHFIYYRLSNSQRENRIFFFCVWALWRGSLSPSVWLIVRWFEWYLSLYCSEDRWRRWGAEWWRHERNKQWNVWFRVQLRTLVFARGCNKSWESFIKKKNIYMENSVIEWAVKVQSFVKTTKLNLFLRTCIVSSHKFSPEVQRGFALVRMTLKLF